MLAVRGSLVGGSGGGIGGRRPAFGEVGHGLDDDPHLLDLVSRVDDPEAGHPVGERDDFAGAFPGCFAVPVGLGFGGMFGDLSTQ